MTTLALTYTIHKFDKLNTQKIYYVGMACKNVTETRAKLYGELMSHVVHAQPFVTLQTENAFLVYPNGHFEQFEDYSNEDEIHFEFKGLRRDFLRDVSKFTYEPSRFNVRKVASIEVVAQTGLRGEDKDGKISASITDVVEGLRIMYAPFIEKNKAPFELFKGLIEHAEELTLIQREGDLLYVL